jgi:phosphopantothenoylcysteine decarboxylase/phosphopantothenate--cysteine ligase
MLARKHILIGVTGGIAAYKIPLLVRELRRKGAEIRIVMTNAAKEFVTPTTLSTLSGNPVITDVFPDSSQRVVNTGTWHIEYGRWADVMLIAPATANTMAKLAQGYADNAVTMLALALRCPLLVSPAMDADMWNHPSTQANVITLRESGCTILPPNEGELASGLMGPGRLPEIDSLVNAIENVLSHAHRDLEGRKILVTAGPTQEAIDPVRFIGNRSSGKMGFAIANAAAQRGARVTLVTGRVALTTPRNVKRVDVESAEEMYRAVQRHKRGSDVIIMAAAVADFAPAEPSSQKLKKERINGTLTLELHRTKDILASVAATRENGSILVGFALETHNELRNAKRKLTEKHLDLIILNNPLTEGAGFGSDTNIVTIVGKNGRVERLRKLPKFDVAHEILNRVVRLLDDKR